MDTNEIKKLTDEEILNLMDKLAQEYDSRSKIILKSNKKKLKQGDEVRLRSGELKDKDLVIKNIRITKADVTVKGNWHKSWTTDIHNLIPNDIKTRRKDKINKIDNNN